jgi:DivIVA domain-containing protein
MDLTPQTLREVEFREKLRGYHPDDVDDFLEKVAVGLGQLLDRLAAAEAGQPAPVSAGSAPVRDDFAPPSSTETSSNETLRRTLVLAQRTADLAISEAEETARQLVAQAEEDAARVRQEADAHAAAMVGDLETKRAGLEREVASLHAWVSQHRDRIRAGLNDQIRVLDAWLAANPPPRPSRPSPALRSTLRSADRSGDETLGARRASTGVPAARAPRVGGLRSALESDVAGPDRGAPENSRSLGDLEMDAIAAADDDAVKFPTQESRAASDAQNPAGNAGETDPSRATGLGSRLYRRR